MFYLFFIYLKLFCRLPTLLNRFYNDIFNTTSFLFIYNCKRKLNKKLINKKRIINDEVNINQMKKIVKKRKVKSRNFWKNYNKGYGNAINFYYFKRFKLVSPRAYFFLFWWNIGWGGVIKNGAKKIDYYFFVEIEKKNQIKIARGFKLKTKS